MEGIFESDRICKFPGMISNAEAEIKLRDRLFLCSAQGLKRQYTILV